MDSKSQDYSATLRVHSYITQHVHLEHIVIIAIGYDKEVHFVPVMYVCLHAIPLTIHIYRKYMKPVLNKAN